MIVEQLEELEAYLEGTEYQKTVQRIKKDIQRQEKMMAREEKRKQMEYNELQSRLAEIEKLKNETTISESLEEIKKDAIYTICQIVELRSKDISDQSLRVAKYAQVFMQLISYDYSFPYSFDEEESYNLFYATHLFNIGKIGIPDAILNKPYTLSDEEQEIMDTYPILGYNILKNSTNPLLQIASMVANEHCEKFDGTGFPNGLKGEETHLFTRIVSLCNRFDQMRDKDISEVLEHIKGQSGISFDPMLVEMFLANIDQFLQIKAEC